MKFVLNKEFIEIELTHSDQTILSFLREERHLTGTKEGCASGDCGACTILVGTAHKKTIEYKTLNACITPLGMIEGKHLVTIENLSNDDSLHPSQKSMVEEHGSQCGFCTPGFVMSLAGFYENNKSLIQDEISRESICEAISGNLCRCTGYKPIIKAGVKMFSPDAEKTSGENQTLFNEDILQHLLNLKQKESSSIYFSPKSIRELHKTLQNHPNSKIIAGGTDLMLETTQKYKRQPTLIDVSNVKEMIDIREDQKYIYIGAATTYSDIEVWSKDCFPELNKLLKRLGSRQIRNSGTIGGNIGNASPIADLPPALIAINTSLEIGKPSGEKHYLSLDDFYLGYKKTRLNDGEFIASIRIEKEYLSHFHRFIKLSKRMEDDISSVMLGVSFIVSNNTIDKCRLAYGGVAEIPIRLNEVESLFIGKSMGAPFDKEIEKKIHSLVNPISDVRASARYRIKMAINLLKKAYMELNGEQIPDLATVPSEAICA